jgi:hypothetical protein
MTTILAVSGDNKGTIRQRVTTGALVYCNVQGYSAS